MIITLLNVSIKTQCFRTKNIRQIQISDGESVLPFNKKDGETLTYESSKWNAIIEWHINKTCNMTGP